jgi:hypothetical protein
MRAAAVLVEKTTAPNTALRLTKEKKALTPRAEITTLVRTTSAIATNSTPMTTVDLLMQVSFTSEHSQEKKVTASKRKAKRAKGKERR